jgi:error-prone DNA polymerase
MVHPYLNRRAGREVVVYPHPALEPILARTLGVPLFQEQLLRMAMVVAGFTGGQAEELRRALGFKRSERRMKDVEKQLRAGMEKNGITGEAAEQIITSIVSFALYGFPESHAASFALLAYASAYFKMHYPAAFYTGLLNNQPMGFYHPSTLVKDAQRRGVRFQPIDVQISDWNCFVDASGAVRMGLRYVNGLREEVGKKIAARRWARRQASGARLQASGATLQASGARLQASGARLPASGARLPASGVECQEEMLRCPKCGCDDPSMLESGASGNTIAARLEARSLKPEAWFCNNCSHDWHPARHHPPRFASLDDLVAHTGLRRDELVRLADIGALNSFGYDRRSALWQAERAVRPAGELFTDESTDPFATNVEAGLHDTDGGAGLQAGPSVPEACPLRPLTESERVVADYAGTGLTLGRHPMAFRRDELATRGIMRAIDLRTARRGRRVRVAGMVITRQRPGTAKGFVFLTLEDETGIANIIIRPDMFARDRLVIVEEPVLIVDGVLQHEDGVVSVRADVIQGLKGPTVDFDAHDFY